MNLTIEVFRGSKNPDEITAQWMHDYYVQYLEDGSIVEKSVLPPMTEEEDAAIQTIKQTVWDKAKTEFSKFVMGTRSMDEYDSFIEELKADGIENWVTILNQAEAEYQAVLAAE